jgi:hypothetical protein
MKRKIVGIFVCMMFIGAVFFSNAIGKEMKQDSFYAEYDVDNRIGFLCLDDSEFVDIYNTNIVPSPKEVVRYNIDEKYFKEKSHVIDTSLQTTPIGKWTWLFYNDADFYRAYDPLEDFAKEAYSSENLDVIVLQDKEHDPAKMWYINENHTAELLQDMGEIDMGDYQTLYDFVNYSKNNFPASRYLISLYDHGGGWTGACVDSTDNGWLTMDDIQRALTETGGVDVICFTAPCLMGALESVYELRDCVDVYVGSEEGSGYGHWWGTIGGICNMLDINPDLPNIEIGEQIIQLIEGNTPWPDSITMSAIRTDKMEELSNSLDIVARDLINNFNESFGNVWSAYGNVESFGNRYCIDTYDFARECLGVEANQNIRQHLEDVMNYVSEAVIAECHGSDHPNAHGLTIYFPDIYRLGYDSTYADPDYDLDFSQHTFWDEFLCKYFYTVEPGSDQEQTECNAGFVVCRKFVWAQSFVPTCNNLAGVKLMLTRLGLIFSDVTISIRNSRDGDDLAGASVSYTYIPKGSFGWIKFDFDDITVTPGETYYILCSTSGGDNIANFYAWGGSNNADSYHEGDVWIQWSSGSWQKWDPPKDTCFKTYYSENPLNPPTITGPTSGKTGVEYKYTFSTTYPNDQNVFYYVDWGDGTTIYWIGPYASGKEITVPHTWINKGTYPLRVQARNISGVVTDWGILEVSMPKNKGIKSPFLNFLENHPYLFPILRNILDL